jgi:eukaryotic-like serine/threonine-protein kinase
VSLTPGERLGTYDILEPLGVGGMGEVFRARDSRLGRDVAIKVLPESFKLDADRLARFEREARVLASLSHPNIGMLHALEDFGGTHALILELVDGPTLAERIAAGPLPLAEVLLIAEQIATALAAAHELGVVHRDLKPGNVKLRDDGNVKLLDFGLAKMIGAHFRTHGSSDVTATSLGTAVVGTPAYMSPEQARGQPVDKRTDIWAFGCVLYEMLTGKRPFAGEQTSDVIAKVIERDPDLAALPPGTPAAIRRLLRRCLVKDPRQRLQDIGDARLEIAEIRAGGSSASDPDATTQTVRNQTRWRERLAWSIALLLLGVVALAALLPDTTKPSIVRFDVDTPTPADPFAFAVSPDGQRLVFVATTDGRPLLWVRTLDEVDPLPLAGTEDASYPFWSPDGGAVGFFADGKLKRKDLAGGAPQVLADAPAARGGAWGRRGDIVFAPEPTVGLKRVAATGGTATTVTELAADQGSHRWPQFLPDGRRFLFFVGLGQATARGVYLASVDGDEPRRVLVSETAALFAPPGYLLRVVDDVLVAYRFDVTRGTLDPESIPLAQPVGTDDGTFRSAFSVSDAGVLAYRPGGGTKRQLVWLDASGAPLGTLGTVDDGAPSAPELSRDGRRLALTRAPGGGTGDIWLIDVARDVPSRQSFDPGVDGFPVWSADGDSLIFASGRDGRMDLFETALGGVTEERLLLATQQDKTAQDWSADGRFLLFTSQDAQTGSDIWAAPVEDRSAAEGGGHVLGEPVPIARSGFDEGQARFSPDGRWIAYVTNETGRQEVYIQSFPGLNRKLRVSSAGGIYPRWRRDGQELFYLAPDLHLMAALLEVETTPPSITPGTPRELFPTRLATTGSYVFTAGLFAKAQYDVSADGRFLMIVADEAPAEPIRFVLNWSAALDE